MQNTGQTTGHNTGKSTTTTASTFASDAAGQLTDAANRAQELAYEQYDRLEASIRRNPLHAAGVAAGIGFFLAVLARR